MSKLRKQATANMRTKSPLGATPLSEAIEHHRSGRFGQAATIYGEILQAEPENFDALHLLGMAAHQTGDHHGALTMIEKALALRPKSADALSNRSAVLMELGLHERALDSCLQALSVDPKDPDTLFNAGNAHAKLGQRSLAIERYSEALGLRPNFVACLTNLAGELIELGDLQGAVNLIEQALSLDPHHREAWLNFGVALQEAGENDKAVTAYENAIAIDPGYVRALCNLATLHLNLGGLSAAGAITEHAGKVAANAPEVQNVLGNYYRALGDPQQAARHYRNAIAGDAKSHGYHSNLLLTMTGDMAESPETLCDEALRFGARFRFETKTLRAKGPIKRVGFVSGDFRIHPVGFFLEPVLAGLNDVEVVLYANQRVCDSQTERLASLATVREIHNLNDDEVVQLIENDQVDVLIDLSGHTADGRMELFSRRITPLQLSWLGYSGTTGLTQFDGIVGDSIVMPTGCDDLYAEAIVRLPSLFAPIFVPENLQPVLALPCEANGSVTFGSFNAASKLNDSVILAWAQVLNEVPDSRLLIKNLYASDRAFQERVERVFAEAGLELDRISFIGQTSREEHFEALRSVDIALDPFPYSGATTTLDSLWSGVPVVTLAGDRYAGRMSASILQHIGLDSLIAEDVSTYVQISTSLAMDSARLRELREGVRERLATCRAADSKVYAEEFQTMLQSLWSTKCQAAA